MQVDPSSKLLDLLKPETFKRMTNMASLISYVNCWNMSEHESAFLWSVYASPSDGIAIRSTIGRLRASLSQDSRGFTIGPIRYINYDTETIQTNNLISPIFCKRKSFEAEKELRVFLLDVQDSRVPQSMADPNQEFSQLSGQYVTIQLKELISVIFICPGAPEWYSDAVVGTTTGLGVGLPVQKSPLLDPAIL
jgi:hypothetical protein